jgi:hypothetical protein
VSVTKIGRIIASAGLTLLDNNAALVDNTFGSFDHFKT